MRGPDGLSGSAGAERGRSNQPHAQANLATMGNAAVCDTPA